VIKITSQGGGGGGNEETKKKGSFRRKKSSTSAKPTKEKDISKRKPTKSVYIAEMQVNESAKGVPCATWKGCVEWNGRKRQSWGEKGNPLTTPTRKVQAFLFLGKENKGGSKGNSLCGLKKPYLTQGLKKKNHPKEKKKEDVAVVPGN